MPTQTFQDMQLVVSELVTNALRHGLPSPITVTVHVGSGRAWLRVVNESPATSVVPQVEDWGMSSRDRITGRGLGIVRSVSDEVRLVRTGREVAFTAYFEIAS